MVGISRKLLPRFHAIVNNSNNAHTAVNTMSATQFAVNDVTITVKVMMTVVMRTW